MVLVAKQPPPSPADEKVGNRERKAVLSPGTDMQLEPKMVLEKEIVDELLLVCGVIGTTTGEGNDLVPVTDCLNWLQDLQRALRRDDEMFRPVSLLIGKWKVVEQKLLPLVVTCRYDTAIVLTVVKILVILTKPLADNTKRAGRMIIDVSNKTDPEIVRHQINYRENALEQAQLLIEYKRIIAHHSSHQENGRKNGLLSIFVSLLAEPLSRTGASRTDSDHLTIELVFHLFRNLLAAEPLLHTSSEVSRQSAQLHQELIILFEQELVLEIFLVLGQEMEARENAQYNLLMMELLHHLLKARDPIAVARSPSLSESPITRKNAVLAAKLKNEDVRRRSRTHARHGNFGGTWVANRIDGKTSYIAAVAKNDVLNIETISKRVNRKAKPFIGLGQALLSHTRKLYTDDSPASQRADCSLHSFCQRFLADCYGPVMKSLKNEFRRDSHRLETTDKVVFFRIVWFFSQWWKNCRTDRTVGHLIFTMDVFTFNLVLNATDTFYQHKQFSRLSQAVALYCEMMHLLLDMRESTDKTEVIMAMGLLDRLFYGAEPLDRLPKLLHRWSPGITTREYLCDLIELCHLCLKILELSDSRSHNLDPKTERSDKVSKMMAASADFDVKGYFLRKIVSNQLVSMYCHLLGHYKINSVKVNHRIVSMLLRLTRIEISAPEAQEVGVPINPLGSGLVTLEPMLFSMHLIVIAGRILDDASVVKVSEFQSLVAFCTNLLKIFLEASRKNPLLFVECLFRHQPPHKYCEFFENLYVTDELRMIGERDLLIEGEDKPCDDICHTSGCPRDEESDDDNSENEFDGAEINSSTPAVTSVGKASERDSLAPSCRIFAVSKEEDSAMTTRKELLGSALGEKRNADFPGLRSGNSSKRARTIKQSDLDLL